MKHQLKIIAFIQAAALTAYVTTFAFAVERLQSFSTAHNIQPHPVFGIVIFLLAFIISALICSSIVFAYPLWLFFAGNKSEALKIVAWNAAWLVIFFILIGLVLLIRL